MGIPSSSLRLAVVTIGLSSFAVTACGGDPVRVANRLEQDVSVELLAPTLGLAPACAGNFALRFCQEEYESLGVVTFAAGEEQEVIFDPGAEEDCANQLWLKVLTLGELGPVIDRGTLIQTPADLEIELGSGRYHTVAFPTLTLRVDEVGLDDPNQADPPISCDELGREPREPPDDD